MDAFRKLLVALIFFFLNLGSYLYVISRIWDWYMYPATGYKITIQLIMGFYFIIKISGLKKYSDKEDWTVKSLASSGFDSLLFIWISYLLALALSYTV